MQNKIVAIICEFNGNENFVLHFPTNDAFLVCCTCTFSFRILGNTDTKLALNGLNELSGQEHSCPGKQINLFNAFTVTTSFVVTIFLGFVIVLWAPFGGPLL